MQSYTPEEMAWATRECERQGEGPEMIPHFLKAWNYARNQFFPYDMASLETQVLLVHTNVMGWISASHYRQTPVVFANGNEGANWQEVPRLMEQLCESDLFWTDTEAFVVEFLRIHPFEDGNGRTASILLNRRTAKDLFVDLPQIEGWIDSVITT